MPKVLPILPISVYTMCQYTAPEPASVQTQVFTHRYGFKIFINSAFILILTRIFTGVHVAKLKYGSAQSWVKTV